MPPSSTLATNCSYQDPLVLAHGQTREEENKNEARRKLKHLRSIKEGNYIEPTRWFNEENGLSNKQCWGS